MSIVVANVRCILNEKCSSAELAGALRSIRSMTTTNCDWLAYAMRDAVADQIRMILRTRRLRRRRINRGGKK